MRPEIRIAVKLPDLWVGAFWDRRPDGFHLWICLVPCLPIHMHWRSA